MTRSGSPWRRAVSAAACLVVVLIILVVQYSLRVRAAILPVDICRLGDAALQNAHEIVVPLHEVNATGENDEIEATAKGCTLPNDTRIVLPGGNDSLRALMRVPIRILLINTSVRGNFVLVGAPGAAVVARLSVVVITSRIDSPTQAVVFTGINLLQSRLVFQNATIISGTRALYFAGGRGGTAMQATFEDMHLTLVDTAVTVDHRAHDPVVGAVFFGYATGAAPSLGSEPWLISNAAVILQGSNVSLGGFWDWPLGVAAVGPCRDLLISVQNSRFLSPDTRLVAFLSFGRIHNASVVLLATMISVTDDETFTVLQFVGLIERLTVVVMDVQCRSQHMAISRENRGLVTLLGSVVDSAIVLRQIQVDVTGGSFLFAHLTRPDTISRRSENVSMVVQRCDIRHTQSARSATRIVTVVGVAGDVHVEVSDCNFYLTELVGTVFVVDRLSFAARRCFIPYSAGVTLVLSGGDDVKDVISNSTFVLEDISTVNVATWAVSEVAVVEWYATTVNVSLFYSGRGRNKALFSKRWFNFPGGNVVGLNLTIDATKLEFDQNIDGSRTDAFVWFASYVLASSIVVKNLRMTIAFPLTMIKFSSTVEGTTIALVNASLTSWSTWGAFELHGELRDSRIIVSHVDLVSYKPYNVPSWTGILKFTNMTNSQFVLQNVRFGCYVACTLMYTTGSMAESLIAVSNMTYWRTSSPPDDVDRIGWANTSVVADFAEDARTALSMKDSRKGTPSRVMLRCVTSNVVERLYNVTLLIPCPGGGESTSSSISSMSPLCSELDCVLMALPAWALSVLVKCSCGPRTGSATLTMSPSPNSHSEEALSSFSVSRQRSGTMTGKQAPQRYRSFSQSRPTHLSETHAQAQVGGTVTRSARVVEHRPPTTTTVAATLRPVHSSVHVRTTLTRSLSAENGKGTAASARWQLLPDDALSSAVRPPRPSYLPVSKRASWKPAARCCQPQVLTTTVSLPRRASWSRRWVPVRRWRRRLPGYQRWR